MKNKKLRNRVTVSALLLVGLIALVGGMLPKPPTNMASQYLTESVAIHDLAVTVVGNGQVTSIDSDAPKAVVMVSEYDISQVAENQSVKLTIGAVGTTIDASVTAISDTADASTGVRTYAVTVQPSSIPSGTRVGMSASAEVVTSTKSGVIAIPVSAITESDGKKTVKVLRSNQVATVSVETGVTAGSLIEIVSGLSAGEQVVTGTNGSIPTVGGSGGFMPPAPGGVTQ